MRIKKRALLMVPVLVLLCASVAVAGNVVDYTYDGDGNIGDAVISAQTPTVHISADPETIQPGASSTLSWTSGNADSCTIDQGIGTVPLSGSTTVSPTETTTYTITATGPGGTATDSVTVTVAAPPTVTISADPASIYEGQSSALTWSSTDADTCEIQPGIGTVGTSGSISVSPTETTTYTITATGPGGTATDSVTVTVTAYPTPTVTISADPETIQEGNSSTLTWTSTNATSCSIDQGIGTVDLNGSTTVSPTETTTYTITATGPGGTATDSVTITVTPPPTPQTLTLRPNAAGDNTGLFQWPFTGYHYDKVDEVTADTNTYVIATGAYPYDLYGIPDHTTETGAINYVKIYYAVQGYSTNYIYGYCKPAIKTGGTVYYGTQITVQGWWTTYNYTWNTNPQTGVAWTWDDIDALQIGIAMGGGYVYCTQVYIKVNYTPSGG